MDPAAWLAKELSAHSMWAGTDLTTSPPTRRMQLELSDGSRVVGHGETETEGIESISRELFRLAQEQK